MNTRVPFVYWKAPTLDVISFWLGTWTWDAQTLQDGMRFFRVCKAKLQPL